MWYIFQCIFLYSTLFTFCLLLFLLFYYKYAFKYWAISNVPHQKPSFPFGNIIIDKNMNKTLSKIYFEMKTKEYKYCGFYLFAVPVFMSLSPEVTKQLLVKHFDCFDNRGFYGDEKCDPLSSNLLTSSGKKWKKMKEKLTHIWTPGKVKLMFLFMKKCTDDLEIVIDELVKTEKPIDVFDISRRYAADIISCCTLGIDANCLKNSNSDIFRYATMTMTNNFLSKFRLFIGTLAPSIAKFFRITLFSSSASTFFRKMIYDLVEYREKNNIERDDILNLLIKLKNNKFIADKEGNSNKINENSSEETTMDHIAAECFIFFLAGFETVATVINFALYEIAKDKDIQQKLRLEIKNTLRNSNNKFNYETVKEMQYLDNVINETLRMYPPVYMLNRICTKDFTIPGTNIIVKKGIKAVIPTLAIHMDPEYYPNPNKFDPNRFTDEAARHSFVYLPFGDGPRICPGNRFAMTEIKLCIAVLLSKYKFQVHSSFEKVELCTIASTLGTEKPILLTAQLLENI